MITPQQIKQIFPQCRDTTQWARYFAPLESKFGINTPIRWAAFLAQVGHESAQLNQLVENLSYGIRGLMATWPKRFPHETAAKPYARNPERLANYVYGDRLGNTEIGDGWKFRGRGLLQTTGRANYAAAGKALGLNLLLQPGLLEQMENAALAAGLYWQTNGLNELADENTEASFKAITHKINGGYNGYDERESFWQRAKAVLGVPT